MLKLGIPSKGRIHEQARAYLKGIGADLVTNGGRSYEAHLSGFDDVKVWLLPAAELARRLHNATLDAALTGEDLLREEGPLLGRVELVAPLGFAKAKVVVAVPGSWIDARSIDDLGDIFHAIHVARGTPARVATKFPRITREKFLEWGLNEFQIVADAGSTEAAPAGHVADIIVDITSTGSTLRENKLKQLSPVLLASEAYLAVSLKASWSESRFHSLERLLDLIVASKDNRRFLRFFPPNDIGRVEEFLLSNYRVEVLHHVSGGEAAFYIDSERAMEAASELQKLTGRPVAVFDPVYILDRPNVLAERLREKVNLVEN